MFADMRPGRLVSRALGSGAGFGNGVFCCGVMVALWNRSSDGQGGGRPSQEEACSPGARLSRPVLPREMAWKCWQRPATSDR